MVFSTGIANLTRCRARRDEEMVLQPFTRPPSVSSPSALDHDDQQFDFLNDDDVDVSIGSPVSSVIPTSVYSNSSTGTLTQGSRIPLDRRHFRVTSRPGSLLSISSSEQPAPPYEVYRSYERIEVATESRPTAPTALQSPLADGETIQPDTRSPTSPIPSSTEESVLVTHYSQIVRTIDQNHAQTLADLYQSHQQEIASLRHDIDQVYRKEFRAKDREIEKIREEAAEREAEHAYSMTQIHRDAEAHVNALEEQHRIAIAKANHAIEDTWEARWNDRTRVDLEEARRTEADNQLQIERAVARRDEQWSEKLKMRHPDILDVWNDLLKELRLEK